MSLTSVLDSKISRSFLRDRIRRPLTGASRCLVPSFDSNNPAAVGTAFDYALRFGLEARFETHHGRLLAEDALAKGLAEAREAELRRRLQVAWETASSGIQDPFSGTALTEDQARACFLLAKLDVVWRAGLEKAQNSILTDVTSSEVDELRALFAVVPWDRFADGRPLLLNPTFQEGSRAIGGADADLIIGDRLVDIKTVKTQSVSIEYVRQLVGYALLANRFGISNVEDRRVEQLGIYFSRAGALVEFPLSACIDDAARGPVLDFLLERWADEGAAEIAHAGKGSSGSTATTFASEVPRVPAGLLTPTDARWEFDPEPASRARTGGDPTSFVFDADLEQFVREVLQNSVDQHVAGEPSVEVRFLLDHVRGDRLEALQDGLDWSRLRSHVAAVAQHSKGTEARRFDTALSNEDDGCLVLWIEDRNTTGLIGPEQGDGSFSALCRDRLFSSKQSDQAGGRFGLGKAVLWRFSRWSTVLFYSHLNRPEPEGEHRFIAKAALPWHQIDEIGYAGDGWFGHPESVDGGHTRAVSLWDSEAQSMVLRTSQRPYTQEETGTAIGILGFHEPADDADRSARELVDQLWLLAERHFWPALHMNKLALHVGERGAPSRRLPSSTAPWREMLSSYLAAQESSSLANEGDIVVRAFSIAIPRRRGASDGVTANVDLLVRLSGGNETDVNELVAFRSAGMTVERRSLSRRSSTARPFHAMLVCGLARREPGDADRELEEFLRAAEPPSHDRWTKTPALKEGWVRGYKKALEGMFEEIERAIIRLVSEPVDHSTEGPERLRKLFPLRGSGGTGAKKSSFEFHNLRAMLQDDGAWEFQGSIGPSEPTDEAWQVRIEARLPEAGGGKGTGKLIADVASSSGEAEVQDGVATIVAPPGAHSVDFFGRTDPRQSPVSSERSAFELTVRGGGAPE